VVVALALVAAVSLGTGANAAQSQRFTVKPLTVNGGPIKAAKSFTARIARSDESLLKLTGKSLVNVMARLDYDPVASYFGGVQGLAATSPEVTHKPLAKNGPAVAAYQDYLARIDNRVLTAIHTTIPQAQLLGTHHTAFGGLSLRVPASRVKDLLAIDGVVAVMQNKLAKPDTNVTPEFIGATHVWPLVGGPKMAASNVVVGVLDTGIWPEHDSFVDKGLPPPPGGPYGCQFGDGSDPDLADPFDCQNKLVGAYAFTDTYTTIIDPLPDEFCDNAAPPGEPNTCSARDANGHGTHTTSTAAGDVNPNAQIFGVPKGTISGMAPGARVIMYRVCLDQGCFFDDMVAAIEQAIMDDIDVMNVSIGPFGPPYSDPVALAFLDAYAAGVTVSVSAGNSGPGAGTSSDPGPWTIVVGASTSPRQYATTLHVTSSDGASFDAIGNTITDGISTATSIVDAEDISGYNDPLCQTPLPSSVAGMIVACERGTNARVQKGYNVSLGGGAGMVLWNAIPNQDTETDNHWVPTVHLGGESDGLDFKAFIDAHPNTKAMWEPGTPAYWQQDVMASFSSRGPVGDFMKPDITAPGVQVLAGNTPEPAFSAEVPVVPGEYYQAIAGTSMSSPHDAGASALIKSLHPDWSPSQIKSVLVTTANSSTVFKEDGVTPADPFDMGGGSLRVNRADKAAVTQNVTAEEFFASADDPVHRVDLNIPTIDFTTLPGIASTFRTFTNQSSRTVRYDTRAFADGDAVATPAPQQFTLAPGESQMVTVMIDATTAEDGQYFGRLELAPRPVDRGPKLKKQILPIAFFKQAGPILQTNSCNDTTLTVNQTAHCTSTTTNTASIDAAVHVELTPTDASILTIKNVSPPGQLVGNNSWEADTTLNAASPPTIDAIVPGSDVSYVSLASLGVLPLTGAGDETVFDLGTSPYLYGGEEYTEIGMVSNGYAVAGPASADDVNYIPQTFPDPSSPNNTIAPLWTDLDPGSNGAMYAAELIDNGTGQTWVVLEWEDVPTYGTTQNQTFQIWLETTAGVEMTSYAYANLTPPGASTGTNVGAENRDGSSGVNLGTFPADNAEYHLETSPPQAGGSVTVTYDAKAMGVGSQDLIVGATAPDVQVGTSTALVNITVS